MDIFKLSRNWFDFCFENPEKIKPNHSALYFFCIEHCNRLGWKDKFGLPSTMAKEAIGISSYNTYKHTLDDLVNWGFITMVQRSKNQYSSNVIALSNFDKAKDNGISNFDKALINHSTKQSERTDSIDIQETKKPETILTWRNDFEIYKTELKEAFKTFLSNGKILQLQQKYNPNLNIPLTIEKSVANYWIKEIGWKKKKASKTAVIDWPQTFINCLSISGNKVYFEKNNIQSAKFKDVEYKQLT